MDNSFLERLENECMNWFLEGFRYAKTHPDSEMPSAKNFIQEIFFEQRKNREFISTAQTDSGHKVTETQTVPDPSLKGGGR